MYTDCRPWKLDKIDGMANGCGLVKALEHTEVCGSLFIPQIKKKKMNNYELLDQSALTMLA